MRYVRAFGRFWWDFLVGDTPEIAVGVLLVLLVAFLLRDAARTVAVVIVSASVGLLLTLSVLRGARR